MAQDKDTGAAQKDAAKRTAETGRAAADQAADTTRELAQHQADLAGKTAETARETANSNLDAFRRISEETVDRFTQMFGMGGERAEELSQQTSRNLDAIVRSTSILAEGYQSVYQEWLDFVQRSVRQNMEGVSTLMGCRTPQDLAATQTDLLKSRMQDLLDSAARMSEMSARAANDAVQRIGSQAERSAR